MAGVSKEEPLEKHPMKRYLSLQKEEKINGTASRNDFPILRCTVLVVYLQNMQQYSQRGKVILE